MHVERGMVPYRGPPLCRSLTRDAVAQRLRSRPAALQQQVLGDLDRYTIEPVRLTQPLCLEALSLSETVTIMVYYSWGSCE